MTENENLMEENLLAQVETEPEAIEPEESTTGEAIEPEDSDADESEPDENEDSDEILEM